MFDLQTVRKEAVADSAFDLPDTVDTGAVDQHANVIQQGITVVYDEIDKRVPQGPLRDLAHAGLATALHFALKGLLRGK